MPCRSKVFCYGYDDDFIIAKQHPWSYSREGSTATSSLNESVTNRYIVEKATENVYGPYDGADFEAKREELGVSVDLQFSKDVGRWGCGK